MKVQRRFATPAQIKRFSVLQALYWAFVASFFAYIISMLNHRGLRSETIGVLTSVLTLGSCFGQFIVSYICDRFETCKATFIVTLLIMQAACCALLLTQNVVMLGVIMFIIGFTKQPLGAVLDTWFIKGVSDDMRAFGKTRSMGSMGFSLTMLAYGFALNLFGYGIMPFVSSILLAALIFLSIKTPDVDAALPAARNALKLSGLKGALTPLILLLFLGTTLLGCANNASYNMLPIILTTLGGTTAHQGIMFFINAGSEIPAMRINWERLHLSPAKRMLISCGVYVLSTFLMSQATNVWHLIILMGFNGFAFGMLLHARRAMVAQLSPGALQGTMHGLGDMLYSGVGPIVGNAMCGYLLGFSGMRVMLLACVVLQSIGTITFYIMYQKSKAAAADALSA